MATVGDPGSKVSTLEDRRRYAVPRPEDPATRKGSNVWQWIERLAMACALVFAVAGIGATVWLFDMAGEQQPAMTADSETLPEAFTTAAGGDGTGPAAAQARPPLPAGTIGDLVGSVAVAALAAPQAGKTEEPTTDVEAVPAPSSAVYVVVRDLNLRAEPRVGAPVLSVLPRGSRVESLRRNDGWMWVRSAPGSGRPFEGWVDARYLAAAR